MFAYRYSRKLVLGSWKRIQVEDYLMLLVFVNTNPFFFVLNVSRAHAGYPQAFYTILMATINVSAQHATNLLLPGELETLTPDDITDRIYGSKVVILLEQAMLICTWLTKACMLMLYNRLSVRLPHQFAIKCISVYVACGFVAVELAWFLSCRPLNQYWALPVKNRMRRGPLLPKCLLLTA